LPPVLLDTGDDSDDMPTVQEEVVKGKDHPRTGTEALYGPYGP